MAKEQYNWKKSLMAYTVFKKIYWNTRNGKETTVKELTEKLKKSKSVVSRQVGCFANEGFLNVRKEGTTKFLSANIKKLAEYAGAKTIPVLDAAIVFASRFDEIKIGAGVSTAIGLAESQQKGLLTMREGLLILRESMVKMEEENKALKEENKELKKQLEKH